MRGVKEAAYPFRPVLSPFSFLSPNNQLPLLSYHNGDFMGRPWKGKEGGVESPSIKSQGFAARNQKPNFSSTLTVFKSRTPSDLLDRALFPNPFGEEATFLV